MREQAGAGALALIEHLLEAGQPEFVRPPELELLAVELGYDKAHRCGGDASAKGLVEDFGGVRAAEVDLRQIEDEWERFWMIDHPSHLTYDRVEGAVQDVALPSGIGELAWARGVAADFGGSVLGVSAAMC